MSSFLILICFLILCRNLISTDYILFLSKFPFCYAKIHNSYVQQKHSKVVPEYKPTMQLVEVLFAGVKIFLKGEVCKNSHIVNTNNF